MLIAAAVFATANARVEDVDLSEHSIARFLAPPDRETGRLPQQEMIKFVALSVPEVVAER